MSDPTTIKVYDDRAADYAEMTDDVTAKDPQLVSFIAACPRGGRVLDLGCGPGAAAAAMAGVGLSVLATDASNEMVARAAQRAGVTARQETFDDIAGTDIYDGIWASFSLLHAPRKKFPTYLEALHQALKPGGVFCIGMKLGDDAARDGIGRHYTYYSVEGLRAHLTDAGFTVKDHVLGSGPGLDGSHSDWISVTAHG